ncbi:hypothetical protein LTR64_007893 [Lithohypha guttulata]|uniref:uncharacterized protein n=1 Tax=Lithohypha guttulata TaxID=1690604 RepID=UPI002DDF3016|nr:hypothetical protein LTR51_008239 [Lithohypha guttulata]
MSEEDNKTLREQERQSEPRVRPAWRALVQDFEPLWFTECMNAGIIAILLHQLPYQFPGLGILSIIAFMIDFLIFIVFSLTMLTRFALYTRQAYWEITDNVQQLAQMACWTIAWLTLAALVNLIVSQAGWGGHAFTIVGYVMWWFGAAWSILTLLFVFIIVIRRQKGEAEGGQLPPMILLPIVSIATTATTGGLIACYSAGISARMAVPVIIVSFLYVGIGMFMATFLYTLLLHKLLTTGFPAPMQIASMFLFVGPMGQSAAALQLLASAASTYGRFGGYSQGIFLQASAATPLNAACVLLALLLTGMATVWAFLALFAMLEKAFNKNLSWSPTWNSIIFPLGTLTTSTLQLSIEMDSPAWRTITTALVIILVIMFFINLGFTTWNIIQGKLLIVKENPRVEEKSE